MFVAIAVVVLAAAPNAAALKKAGAPGVASIKPTALSGHVRFLSHDLLEGRGTGTRGEAIAAEYVASQFLSLGLEPAGENGTWFQPVKLREVARDLTANLFELQGAAAKTRFEPIKDFLVGNDGEVMTPEATAPVVFVGYGVTAPEQNHDDLAGVDLKGKLALILGGAPPKFPSTARAFYSRTREKHARLLAAGAVGVIQVWTPAYEHMYAWEKVIKDAGHPDMVWMDGERIGSGVHGIPVRATLSPAGVEKFLQAAGVSGGVQTLVQAADAGKASTVQLKATAHVAGRGTPKEITSQNVVAKLPGSDPKLAAEYVVYGAHLDHIGIGVPVEGDSIYNGALDNASGTASIIEIARAFTRLPKRPARSILFVAFTGEEHGSLGSEYFARKPTVPPGSMVANVNVDMIVAIKPVNEIVALGDQHSTLGEDVAAAAKAAGVAIGPDKWPEQVLFIRSDQISFVVEGVPALFILPGDKDLPSEKAGERAELNTAFLKNRYHAPKDEWSAPISWEGQAKVTEVAFLTGLSAANRKERPAWKKGDFFSRFAKPAAER